MNDITPEPPPGYFVAYGGNENAEGWFYGPSCVDQVFYQTRWEAIGAAWKAYTALDNNPTM